MLNEDMQKLSSKQSRISGNILAYGMLIE